MTLYEINQAAYKSLPPLIKEQIEEYEKQLSEYLRTHMSKYYMILCNERRYYTVYTWDPRHSFYKNTDKMAWEIMNITKSIGTLKGIEFLEDNTVEFWIEEDDECNAYHLFDYERGVVEV